MASEPPGYGKLLWLLAVRIFDLFDELTVIGPGFSGAPPDTVGFDESAFDDPFAPPENFDTGQLTVDPSDLSFDTAGTNGFMSDFLGTDGFTPNFLSAPPETVSTNNFPWNVPINRSNPAGKDKFTFGCSVGPSNTPAAPSNTAGTIFNIPAAPNNAFATNVTAPGFPSSPHIKRSHDMMGDDDYTDQLSKRTKEGFNEENVSIVHFPTSSRIISSKACALSHGHTKVSVFSVTCDATACTAKSR